MAKCQICGKKGLFLRLNSMGICSSCFSKIQKKKEEEHLLQIQNAQNYYNEIVSTFSEIQSELELDEDIISRENLIPAIEEKMKLCDKLDSLLKTYTKYPSIDKIIISNVQYKDSFSKSTGIGYIEELPITTIFTDNHSFSIEKIFNELITITQKMKDVWRSHIYTIYKNANFERTLLSLDSYSIKYTTDKKKKLNLYEMPEIKHTNITSKSNYDKLGTFVTIDVETTGLSAGKDEIIEVAAVLFLNWTPNIKFETLVKPKKEVPYNITFLTGISSKMLFDSPNFEQILNSLNKFVGSHNIVGHNLDFDLSFLYKNGFDFFTLKRKYFDTLELARRTLKNVENYKLDTLCDYYKIRDNSGSHRALSDCLATGYLFKNLAQYRTTNWKI